MQNKVLPFAPNTFRDWPDIEAYSVTRPRPRATVAVESQRGDPLVTFQTAGQGRVVAVTSGLGAWAPQWMQWREWPRLAGGLADWVSGVAQDGTLALAVTDLPGRVQVAADVRSAKGWAGPDGLAIAVKSPGAESRAVPVDYAGPGRLHADVPENGAGLYTVVVSTPLGTQRTFHLRRQAAEDEAWGTNPAIEEWKRAGLVTTWDARSLAVRQEGTRAGHPPDRWLVGLALALFLSGVIVDLRFRRHRLGFSSKHFAVSVRRMRRRFH
jgi:hypothetical protein